MAFKKTTLTDLQKNFWKRERVSLRNLKTGAALHATFSYDAEFLVGDVFTYLRARLPQAEMDVIDGRLNALATPLTKSEVLQRLHLTEAQLPTFALRRGVEATKPSFALSDFSARSLSILFGDLDYNSHQRLESILKFPIESALHKDGVAAEFEMDGKSPEIKHASSSAGPKTYLEQILKLHGLLKNPQTHFHVALPKDAVSYHSSAMIARAAESRIILGLLRRADPAHDKSLPWDSTQLGIGRTDIGGRGLVKLEFDAFKEPFAAHDFEIREWNNLEDGLQTVALVTSLLEGGPSDARLQAFNRPTLRHVDERYGAVSATLEVVSKFLIKNPETRELATLLHKLAEESNAAFANHRLENNVIERIARVVREREVVRLYDEALLSARGNI